jgi:hypothetical protein
MPRQRSRQSVITKDLPRYSTEDLTSRGVWPVLSVLHGTLAIVAAELPPELSELAALQRGVLSRAQVLAAGLTDEVITARLSPGSWRRLYPGIYAVFTGEVS